MPAFEFFWKAVSLAVGVVIVALTVALFLLSVCLVPVVGLVETFTLVPLGRAIEEITGRRPEWTKYMFTSVFMPGF